MRRGREVTKHRAVCSQDLKPPYSTIALQFKAIFGIVHYTSTSILYSFETFFKLVLNRVVNYCSLVENLLQGEKIGANRGRCYHSTYIRYAEGAYKYRARVSGRRPMDVQYMTSKNWPHTSKFRGCTYEYVHIFTRDSRNCYSAS